MYVFKDIFIPYMDIWKSRLSLSDLEHKRYLYETCVVPRSSVSCPELEATAYSERAKRILLQYITVHQADGYDEQQWCILHNVCKVFSDDADAFWAFALINGYQRPYRPIHGERAFSNKVEEVCKYVKLELCILDNDLCTCLETTLNDVLPRVVARWFSTWFAIVGAGIHFYTATIACPAKLRTKWLSLVTARLLFRAAGDIPRIYARRNDIYRVFSTTRIEDDKELIQAAKQHL
jgi:hypothetical protein